MSDTPHVELCATAAHLTECGECADVIGKIVRDEILALTGNAIKVPVPDAPEVETERFDADGVKLSGLITSHADIPNASDHPIEYADKCGICIARRRKATESRGGGGAAAVIAAIDRL